MGGVLPASCRVDGHRGREPATFLIFATLLAATYIAGLASWTVASPTACAGSGTASTE
jgi:hypothetical protein